MCQSCNAQVGPPRRRFDAFPSGEGCRRDDFNSAGTEKASICEPSSVYDFRVDYKDISDRVAVLTQEIRDLQQVEQSDGNHRVNRASQEQRILRMHQIKEELSRMMSNVEAH